MLDRIKHESSGNRYQLAFSKLLGARGPDVANEVVRRAVLRSHTGTSRIDVRDETALQELESNPASWHVREGLSAFAEIVKTAPHAISRFVLTTNFDPLIEVALRKAGLAARTLVASDDQDPRSVHGGERVVVHLHGHWSHADTLHVDLDSERPRLAGFIEELLTTSVVVCFGYGGWPDVFRRALETVIEKQLGRLEVLWALYQGDPKKIAEEHRELLAAIRGGLKRRRVAAYAGIDLHEFLPSLASELVAPRRRAETNSVSVACDAVIAEPSSKPAENAASPYWIGTPIPSDEYFCGRRGQIIALEDLIAKRTSAQIVGERRMGKTSLLRYFERRLRRQRDARIVWLHATRVAGTSPRAFVLEIASQLSRFDEIAKRFESQTDRDELRIAQRAMRELCPMYLLIDEAEALAERASHFASSFFDELRTLTQDRELVWLSTSRVNMHRELKRSSIVSAFLNDAPLVFTGALEPDEASELARRGLDEKRSPRAIEIAGRFPLALQYVCSSFHFRARAGLAEHESGYSELSAHFADLWSRRSKAERELLLRAVVQSENGTSVANGNTRIVLMKRGLLAEQNGAMKVEGELWRGFLRERR